MVVVIALSFIYCFDADFPCSKKAIWPVEKPALAIHTFSLFYQ